MIYITLTFSQCQFSTLIQYSILKTHHCSPIVDKCHCEDPDRSGDVAVPRYDGAVMQYGYYRATLAMYHDVSVNGLAKLPHCMTLTFQRLLKKRRRILPAGGLGVSTSFRSPPRLGDIGGSSRLSQHSLSVFPNDDIVCVDWASNMFRIAGIDEFNYVANRAEAIDNR